MAHWSEKKEKGGSIWQMRLLFRIYKFLGPKGIAPFLHIVVFFFYLFSPGARRVSRQFLTAVAKKKGEKSPRKRDVYYHFVSFSFSLLEKLSAWDMNIRVGDLIPKTPDIKLLVDQLKAKKGAVILCSHLGNMEVLRALASLDSDSGELLPPFGINSIVDFSNTSRFNKFLEEINPKSMVRLVSTRTMGADTIIDLKERISAGDLVIIAADRTAADNRGKTGTTNFLGETAYFPQGALVLASLMDAPVYHMFAVRTDDKDQSSPYEFHVYQSKFDLSGSRKERMVKIQGLLNEYVSYLEALCVEHPYQWYNFFDFWKNPESA